MPGAPEAILRKYLILGIDRPCYCSQIDRDDGGTITVLDSFLLIEQNFN